MIPTQNIVAWGQTVPWAEQRQVEQDLIITRALVEIFNDSFLKEQLRFRGGTALNKLHFAKPLRYSEDIDLVRTSHGPIGPIIDALRRVLEPWMGRARYDQSPVAPKLRFRIEPEDESATIRMKVEINTTEAIAYEPTITIPFEVKNPWFTGRTDIPTFAREEILATKLRALLQRDKGRDMIDLSHAKTVFGNLDTGEVTACLGKYLKASGQAISRAEAEERMFNKLDNTAFMADVRPLLSADEAEKFDNKAARSAFKTVFSEYIKKIPGHTWAKTKETAERVGMTDLV
jgi:predicted nucleotidyltransferase component of viral defense system